VRHRAQIILLGAAVTVPTKVQNGRHHYLTPNTHVITPAPGPGLSAADRQRQPTAV